MAGRPGALRFGSLGERCVHLCVDMQRLFAGPTEWHTPWLHRVLPNIERIAQAHPARTIFTRFVPAQRPGDGEGTWRRYYRHWASMTLDRLGAPMVELVPELARHVPPAQLLDKRAYSPWFETGLHDRLKSLRADSIVVTGGETDVCVLASVLGAIDRGYRVILVGDALCSSSDQTHDSLMTLYETRFGQQVELVGTETVLNNWTPEKP